MRIYSMNFFNLILQTRQNEQQRMNLVTVMCALQKHPNKLAKVLSEESTAINFVRDVSVKATLLGIGTQK